MTVKKLESEFLEKPFVFTGLKAVFQFRFDLTPGFPLGSWVLQVLLVDNGLVYTDIDGVPGWHQVVVVDDLDESLQFSAPAQLLRLVFDIKCSEHQSLFCTIIQIHKILDKL